MLQDEVLETLLYGYATSISSKEDYDRVGKVEYVMAFPCLGWRK